MFGQLLQGLALFFFASLIMVDDTNSLIFLSGLARFAGGIGTACFMTPFYAYIPILYPYDVEKKIGISEFISGFAMLMGPVVGSLLFMAGGYTVPFLAVACLDLGIIPFLNYYFNQKENQQKQDGEITDLRETTNSAIQTEGQATQGRIGYLQVFIQYPVFMQFLMVFACNICFTYFQPIIAEFYLTQYNIESGTVGYLMAIVTGGYAVGSYTVGHIKKRKRLMVCLSCIIFGATYLFVGPDKTFTGLDHHLSVTLTSQIFMGIFTAPVYIPAVPILNEILGHKYPCRELETANLSSAVFTTGMSLGQFIGPIVSGSLAEKYGFDLTCALLGIFLIILAISYIPMIFLEIPEIQQEQDIQKAFKETADLQNSLLTSTDSKESFVQELHQINQKLEII